MLIFIKIKYNMDKESLLKQCKELGITGCSYKNKTELINSKNKKTSANIY